MNRGPLMLEHALAYARAGIEVFPLRGKAPAIPVAHRAGQPGYGICRGECGRDGHGFHDATSDLATVVRWWAQEHPRANIGIRPAPGLVVLDVDPRAHGASALVGLMKTGYQLPQTWTAETGGGGLHAWYRAGGDLRKELCPGVDLKGHATGYVVAAPSVHPDTGRSYRWLNDLPPAIAPEWMLPALRPAPPVQVPTSRHPVRDYLRATGRTADGLVRVVAEAPAGERNRRLYWSACRAAERGALDELAAHLADAARSVGLPEHEVVRTIESARRQVVAA